MTPPEVNAAIQPVSQGWVKTGRRKGEARIKCRRKGGPIHSLQNTADADAFSFDIQVVKEFGECNYVSVIPLYFLRCC